MSPRGGKREGAGPPLKYGEPTRMVSLRLPASAADRLRTEAERRGLSQTELLIVLLRSLA